jgi:hydroxyacylglutathione hydrolase
MVYQRLQYYKSVKLADNLHCYIWQGRGNNCNSCLFADVLRGEHPHVLIDPGHNSNESREACFSYLTKAIETDGFKIEDIGLIINTHSHMDHCGANDVIIEKNSASVAISEEEETFRNTLGQRMYSMFGEKPPIFKPFFYLKEGTLNLGTQNKLDLQVLLTPGHSPGSICLYWSAQKILITGDVVFFGSIGRTDFPGGSMSELKKSIDKLSQFDVEYLVPGHSTEYGDIIKGKQNVQRNFQAIKLFV